MKSLEANDGIRLRILKETLYEANSFRAGCSCSVGGRDCLHGPGIRTGRQREHGTTWRASLLGARFNARRYRLQAARWCRSRR